MYRFKMKLTIVMILFSFIISFVNVVIDHHRLKNQVLESNQLRVQQIEDTIAHSLKSIEKAYDLFDKDTASKMKTNTDLLIDLYKENPLFDEWDFKKLKEILGVDIYIINKENVITHSSFENDIGLDFEACCGKLATILDERRTAGHFYADGIDIEQQTGLIKKYSYMATPDKEFLIELGYTLQNGLIFQEFNFLDVIQELEQKFETINEINVLNIGGYSLGSPVEDAKLSTDRRKAFDQALSTTKTTELKVEIGNEQLIYRYVPYISKIDKGSTQYKVIEIVYNEKVLQSALSQYFKIFIIQFVILIAITTVISIIISNWVSKPMYLAFHDSLTGLKNRAAFDDLLQKKLIANKHTLALMIIDIDDFKTVNDDFGHDAGDFLLRLVADQIKAAVRQKDITVRLGGDEFVVIMPSTNKKETIETAKRIISSINKVKDKQNVIKDEVTASIGIALAPEHGNNSDMLYKKADVALYASKERGKNQYFIYDTTQINTGEKLVLS